MARKYKTYIVTKHHEEEGEDLITQWVIKARSRKEAVDEVLEDEGIIIEEKIYVQKENSELHGTAQPGLFAKDSDDAEQQDRAADEGTEESA